jgi:hypothetical protein
MAEPTSFFLANAPPDNPLSYEALQMRRKIAETLLGKRSPFPKNLGEGLTYAGEKISDIAQLRAIDRADSERAAMLQKQANELALPGMGVTPAVPARRTSEAETDIPTTTAVVTGQPATGDDTELLGAGPTFRIANNSEVGSRVGFDTAAQSLHPEMKARLQAAYNAMPENIRHTMVLNEGYRPREYQQYLYNTRAGRGPVASPGTSQHEAGYAVDVDRSPALDWLQANGPQYGLTGIRGDYPHIQMARGARSFAAPAGVPLPASDPRGRIAQALTPEEDPSIPTAAAPVEGDHEALPANVAKLASLGDASVAQANPMIPSDIKPVPPEVRTPAVQTAQAGVPHPLSPPAATPLPPPLAGTPQQWTDRPKPVPPVKNEALTEYETRGLRALYANPTDPAVKAMADRLISFGAAQREADYARKVDAFKADMDIYKKQEEQKQSAALLQNSPKAILDLTEAQKEAARKQRDLEHFGGLTFEQAIAPLKEGYGEVKNLAAASLSIANAEKVLTSDPKMFTGSAAEINLSIKKLAAAAGWPLDPKIAPTEAFKNYIAGVVASLRPQIVAGGSQSNTELAALQQAAGAKSTLERDSILTILSSVKELNKIAAIAHQNKVEAVTGSDPNRQRIIYPTYGVPGMEHVVPDYAVKELRNHYKEDPTAALKEFDDYFKTPGLGEKILQSGR